MDRNTSQETAIEVCKVLDTLATLSLDIQCHRDVPDDEKVLTARRVRETCAAIHDAVAALKKILQITEQHGGGMIPPDVMQRLEDQDT